MSEWRAGGWDGRGVGEGRMGDECVMGTEFQLCKVKWFWRWVVLMAAQQWECA